MASADEVKGKVGENLRDRATASFPSANSDQVCLIYPRHLLISYRRRLTMIL